MKIGTISETVILIDSDFLNESINDNLSFYQDLYQDKKFEQINLADLLYKFVINSRIEESGHNVDILFAYTLKNDCLTHCEPNNLFYFNESNQIQMVTDKGNFIIRSFFADEGESCRKHFINLLKMVNSKSNVSRIILVADNYELNSEIEMLLEESEKSIFMIKKYNDSEIGATVKYVNIDYLIAYALGLNNNEI